MKFVREYLNLQTILGYAQDSALLLTLSSVLLCIRSVAVTLNQRQANNLRVICTGIEESVKDEFLN